MDLETAQQKFFEIFNALETSQKPNFVLWMEYKIAEFKINRNFTLDNGNFKQWLMGVFYGMMSELAMTTNSTSDPSSENQMNLPDPQFIVDRQYNDSSPPVAILNGGEVTREFSLKADSHKFLTEMHPSKRKLCDVPRRVSAECRALQFPEDVYVFDEKLMCRFCQQCLDFRRLDSVKDHIRSKKHTINKNKMNSSWISHISETLNDKIVNTDSSINSVSEEIPRKQPF